LERLQDEIANDSARMANYDHDCYILFAVLGEIALTQTISPIATHFSVAWSVVCLSSVSFVHRAQTVRRISTPLSRYTCGVQRHIVLDEVEEKGRLGS